jgi:hypothetical protein
MYFHVSPEAAKPAGPRGVRIIRKTRNTIIAYRPTNSVIKYYDNVTERHSAAKSVQKSRWLDVASKHVSNASEAPGYPIHAVLPHPWTTTRRASLSQPMNGTEVMRIMLLAVHQADPQVGLLTTKTGAGRPRMLHCIPAGHAAPGTARASCLGRRCRDADEASAVQTHQRAMLLALSRSLPNPFSSEAARY